jgi:4-amino-4-deoxy-L-arabinose transferase-like glycosyltransferase
MSEGVGTDTDRAQDGAGILPTSTAGRWLLALVLLVALGARVGAVLASESWYEPRTDAEHFDITASSLAAGDGYGYAIVPPNDASQREPTAMRAPLYPVALAAVYVVFGEHSWTAGRLLNSAFGTIGVALLGVVAAQLWSRRLAWVAMAIFAVHPAFIVVGSSLQLEPLFVALLLGSVAAALQHRRQPRGLLWPSVAGVLLGLNILTRETAFLALPGIVWLIWTAPRGDAPVPTTKRSVPAPLLVVALAAAVVLPWTVRNAVVLGEFVPVTTNAGVGLAGTFNETSMNDKVYPAGWREPWSDPEIFALLESMDDPTEAEADQRLRKASFDFIREHPGYFFKAAYYNSQRLFDLDGGHYDRAIAPYLPYSSGMLDLAIVASWGLYVLVGLSLLTQRAVLRQVPRGVWAIPLLMYLFIALFLPGQIRYRNMLEPFLILVATPLVASWIEWLVARRRPTPSPAPQPS